MKTVICTTGTSIARGAARLDQCESEEAYVEGIRARVAVERDKAREAGGGDEARARRALLSAVSAETHALLALGPIDHIVLLHTDTPDGAICARELGALIEDTMQVEPRLERVEGLQVTDAQRFRRVGVQNLFQALTRIRTERGGTDELILNATGGFKGVVAYLTLYGLLYRLRVVYLFEFTDELINLPPAPLSFDFEGLARANDALALLKREGVIPKERFFAAIEGLDYHERDRFEALLEEDGDQVTLSCFGQLFEDARELGQSEVLLHRRARETYEASDGSVRPVFERLFSCMADPLWRAAHIHAFQSTDLLVWKVPRSKIRAAGYERGSKVYICLIYVTDYAGYRRELPEARLREFEEGPFSTWTAPLEQTPERGIEEDLVARALDAEARASEAEEAQLRAELAQEESALRIGAQHEELAQAEAAHDAAERARREAESEAARLRERLDATAREATTAHQPRLRELPALAGRALRPHLRRLRDRLPL